MTKGANQTTPTKAVIYCRVSSSKQATKGDGLGSQETRCREYARYHGLEVVKVFQDDFSGGTINRPGMQELLQFLQKHRAKEQHVVIIDDLNRFSRDVMVHWQLRAALAEAGGKLESPSIEFGDDSDSILVENLLASVSQHQRQKNGEQTINRMRARTMNGYWCFAAPIGYAYKRVSGHGNMLVRDEPYASILQEALEGFASGRFDTQVEVKRFLEAQPAFPKEVDGRQIRNQRITEYLTRPIYAGYLEAPKWNVSLRKGQHVGLISYETFLKIQDRLKAGAKAPARKDINADFPLRGFVTCGSCGKPLTACWSKSKTGKKHPYYMCYNRACESKRKSIPRDKVEGEFTDIVRSLQPTEKLFEGAVRFFKLAWDQRAAQHHEKQKTLEMDAVRIEKKIEQLLDRIIESENASVISAYEQKIAKLEKEKLLAAEKLSKSSKPRRGFDDLFELAIEFLSNPWKLWVSDSLTDKQTVLRLAFARRLSYHREKGFSNPEFTMPFKALGGDYVSFKEMAHRGGFEPPTPRFVVWCSIQLSYRCIRAWPAA